MRLETWELFEKADEGTQFYGDDHEKYIKPEQGICNHLDGCAIRISDGKIRHWSKLYEKRGR